jgi:hypothetical protein
MQSQAGIILADLQFPNDNPVLLNSVEKYMAFRRWNYLVYLGDMLDMDAISHHAMESGDQRSLEGKRLKKDYQAFSKILRRHRKIVGRDCQIYYFMGNHEEWASRLIDTMPTLEGFIEPENNLPFEELKIKVIPPRGVMKIGKLHFIHGDIDRGAYGSIHHAKKVVELYNKNVAYGDKHTQQSFTKVSPVGLDETHTAYAIPCLANIRPTWAKDKPNSWLNGFGVFFIRDDGGFNLYTVVAIHNTFTAPDGYSF